MIRRFGQPPRTDQIYRLRPGCYGVLLKGRDVLLTHQISPTSEIQLPGGGMDQGESPMATLHREVLEETGWRIAPIRRLGAFRRFTYMPEYDMWAQKLCQIYLARPVTQLYPPTEPDHQAVWLPLAEAIPALANSGDRHFAAKLL